MHRCGSVLRARGWQTVSLLCGRRSQCGSRAGAAYRSGSGCCDGPRLTGLGCRCTDENGGPPRLTSRPCCWGHMWSNWRKSSAHASLSKTWMIRQIRGGGFFSRQINAGSNIIHHLPLASKVGSHAQITAQIFICDVQKKVSIHLEFLRNNITKHIRPV